MSPKPLQALLEELLSLCRMNGTSVTQAGIKVSTNRLSGEIIIFFDIDSPKGKVCLNMNTEGLRICDYLIFYSKEYNIPQNLDTAIR